MTTISVKYISCGSGVQTRCLWTEVRLQIWSAANCTVGSVGWLTYTYQTRCSKNSNKHPCSYPPPPTWKMAFFFLHFLAHLSLWLTRSAYSIPMVRRPSVVHPFEFEYLWGQLANLDQILCVALLGVGKDCIMFWGRLDQNSGVHGNRKPPLTYNGENGVSTFSRLLLYYLRRRH